LSLAWPPADVIGWSRAAGEKSGDNYLPHFDFGFAFRYHSISRAAVGFWIDAASGSHELLTAYLFAGGEFFIPLSAIEGRLQGVAALVGFLSFGDRFSEPPNSSPDAGSERFAWEHAEGFGGAKFRRMFLRYHPGSIGNFPTKTKAWYGIDAEAAKHEQRRKRDQNSGR
jgi:hypothetical protein